MAYHSHRILVVVPARGGSKGIPRKNLRTVGDKSLVAHAASIAAQMKFADATILSTDDPEIASEGKRFGLEVPFLRPENLSNDMASSIDVWKHAWLAAEKIYKYKFDLSILLEPTSPLRRLIDIERALDGLINSDVDCSFTVSPTPAHYTPEKALKVSSNNRIDFYLPADQTKTIRQMIPSYVHRNGICYVVRRRHLIEEGRIVSKGSLPILITRSVVNIDEPYELELANWLYERDKRQEE